ncbi:MAG: apolipoprotein A1/A4/E family protein [Nitrosopumilus sp.]|uniref:apolipoprotein A1/A4/E family protein n=1 Tax=Nitrosopumilus sp. TaxID=2024843 RepID=UPI00247D15DE|nr:apolipoprotein A1/A4/E family protein [Nitrosopumilus sp.]MCV0392865.1 apolipoprotein A1/A4/E family protein [Nitrosopumilus sp.]
MDKKFVFFGIMASILLGGSFGIFSIDESFAQNTTDKDDFDKFEKQIEKVEEKKQRVEDKLEEKKQRVEDKLEEKKQRVEDKLEEKKQRVEDKLEEKKQRVEDKLEEKKQRVEDKLEEKKQRAEEKLQRLEDKKAKLESDRKRLEEKLIEKANDYKQKLEKIKEKYQNNIELNQANDVEKFSALSDKLESKIENHSEKIREKLLEKSEKLDTRTQKILEKINSGDYLGKKMGKTMIDESFELVFDSVDATSIGNDSESSLLTGFMTFKTFDKSKSNLKLELQECEILVDDVPYNCGFGKARAISSGDSGTKDSLVIIAFLEDNLMEEVHSTLKIYLNSDSPINEIDGSTQVSLLGPQSKISHLWFLEGDATLTKIISSQDEIPNDTADENSSSDISVELNEDVSISGN